MRYFSNNVAEAVIREDDNGNRYIKYFDDLIERGPTPKEDEDSWGIPTYGIYNYLEPISKEDYETFGRKWDWDPYSGERRNF